MIETIQENHTESHEEQKIIVLVMSDKMGNGDDILGAKLMVNYIKTLKEMGSNLWQLIFVNGGVHLVKGSSPVIDELQGYQRDGVNILSCGTCLEYFGLAAEMAVGGKTNMVDIVNGLQHADKVITIS